MGMRLALSVLDFLTPLTSFDALRRVANTPVEFESYLDLTVGPYIRSALQTKMTALPLPQPSNPPFEFTFTCQLPTGKVQYTTAVESFSDCNVRYFHNA
jgi:hypothetical protein